MRRTIEGDPASEARGRDRNRRIGATALASAGAKGIAILAGLMTVPLTIHSLGPEQFGLLTTITSATALLVGVADLGLSNGLISAISEAHGKNDRGLARKSVSSAFYMLALVSAVLGIVFIVIYDSVAWGQLFNATSAGAVAIAGPAVATMMFLTLVGLPLGTVNSVQLGYQQGYRSSVWAAAGSVIALAAIAVAAANHAALPVFVLAIAGGPLVANSLNWAAAVHRQPWLLPRIGELGLATTKHLLRVGSLFFVLQVAALAGWQVDNIIVAQILGASAVTQYAVPMKLFMVIPMVLGFAFLPLWPAYREALVRGDKGWVRRTYRRSMMAAIVFSVPTSALLVVLGGPIIHWWVGPSVTPPTVLLLALAAWTVVLSVTSANAMLLNGAHVIGFQVVSAVFMVSANVVISIIATQRIGVSGPAWGSAISVLVFDVVPCTWYSLRILRREALSIAAPSR